MKHFAAAILAFGIMMVALSAARASDTTCTGTLENTTVNGNLVVPNSQTCTLSIVTVTGNVQVGPGATLTVEDGTTVDGNILAAGCAAVVIGTPPQLQGEGGPISVGGNVQIKNCTGGGYEPNPFSEASITIGGNFDCDDNSGTCFAVIGTVRGNVQVNGNGSAVVNGNKVGGNVDINNNTGAITLIEANVISGNLQCRTNTAVSDEGFPNTVAGHKQGQCAGL